MFDTVLVSTNDELVNLFLENKIKFLDIEKIIEESLNQHSSKSNPSIDDIKETIKDTENYIKNYKFY